MGFPGAYNVRRRPQGVGLASDVSTPDSALSSTSTSLMMPREEARNARPVCSQPCDHLTGFLDQQRSALV